MYKKVKVDKRKNNKFPKRKPAPLINAPKSPVTKAQALALKELNFPNATIARMLHVSRNSVITWIKNARDNNLDVDMTAFNAMKDVAKQHFLANDLKLNDLTTKKITKSLKDKSYKPRLTELNELYTITRDPYTNMNKNNDSNNNNVQININHTKDKFDVDID
jgi:hypothetical protein